MHRKRRSLPLIFVLSLAAIAFYAYSNSSLHRFAPPNPVITPRRNPNSVPPTFSFNVKVLAFDRIDSLRRCLRSLADADYGGDRVNLHVYIDHFRAVDPVNGSDLIDAKLEESRRILEFVDGFGWEHGEKLVHYRTGNAGLQAQWLESWWPASDDEFAFVVEDDLEVSALYYKYLKGLIAKYYYDESNSSPSIYGASLQRPRFVPGKHGNKLQLDSDTHIFLYQLVGTWGQLLFPKQWKEFRLWYDAHKCKGIKPILQGMVTTGWYKRMGEKIWTPWFIKFIHSHGYYNIYTNFQHERALSISHRDAGVNYGKSAGPDSFLLDEKSVDFNLWETPPLGNLKWYDFCFGEVLPGRIVRNLDELGSIINSLQKQKTIILFSLYRTSEKVARNLVCHLERLNIRNYIFIGTNSDLLRDLARQGHPVIDSGELINNIKVFRLFARQHSDVDLIKETLVKAYVMKKCLEHGYHTWMVDGNVLPVSDSLFEQVDMPYDFFAARDVEFLFGRSSVTSIQIWKDDLIHKLASAAKSSMDSSSKSDDWSHFAYFVADVLKDMRAVKIARDDSLSFGARLGITSVNITGLIDGKKLLYWNSEVGVDSVERELGNAGMWLIDGDYSCAAVVCHQS